MSHTPRIPFSCSHTSVVGASISMVGNHLGTTHPGPHLPDGAEEPEGGGQFVPPVVEDEDAPTVLHLLKLPFPAAGRHVPAASPAAHHLHVVAADLAQLAGLHRLLQLRRNGS